MTTDNQPLVTFALFAYNQEEYIREAVEGAFAQTYQPLEIILSDDCSSDRTYQIMQEMAAGYVGAHEVRVRRNEQNLGVVPHLLECGKEASGSIVVVAAGDDISLAHRVETHVGEYADPSVSGVSTGFDLIDEQGELVSSGETRPIGVSATRSYQSYFAKTLYPIVVIQGSTASYRKVVFHYPLPEWPIKFSEDNLFNFLIYAHSSRVKFVSDALVRYRMHDRALSNRGAAKVSVVESERRALSAAHRNINKMRTFRWISDYATKDIEVDHKAISHSLRCSQEIVDWKSRSFVVRFISIIREILFHKGKMLTWKSMRLFGKHPRYQPKIYLSRFQRSHR